MYLMVLIKGNGVDYKDVLNFKVSCNDEEIVPVQIIIDMAPQPSLISNGISLRDVCVCVTKY